MISSWVLFLNYKPCTNPPEAVHTSIKAMRGLWNEMTHLDYQSDYVLDKKWGRNESKVNESAGPLNH